MFNQLAKKAARTIGKRTRERTVSSRRRKLANQLQRSLRLESLEDRRLLASDVSIGLVDNPISYNKVTTLTSATYTAVDVNVQIGAFEIANDLQNGLDVVVDTTSGQAQAGTLQLLDAILTTGPSGSLTFIAENDILIGADIRSDNTPLNVTLNSDSDATGGGVVDIGGSITTLDGNLTVGGGANPATTPSIGNATFPFGVAISNSIDTGSGAISIRGTGIQSGNADNAVGVFLNGAIITANSGGLTIDGIGGNTTGIDNDGVRITSSSNIGADTGAINITGQAGGSTNGHDGVEISGSSVTSFGLGAAAATITINGTSNNTTANNSNGVLITGLGANVSTQFGNLSITGQSTGASGGNSNDGVEISNGASVSSLGNGINAADVSIVGTSNHAAATSNGVAIDGLTTSVATSDGALTIDGTTNNPTAVGSTGVDVRNDAAVQFIGSPTTASITVIGNAAGNSGSTFGVSIAAPFGGTEGNVAITGTSSDGDGVGIFSSVTAAALTVNGTSDFAGGRGVQIFGTGRGDANSVDITGASTGNGPGIAVVGGGSVNSGTSATLTSDGLLLIENATVIADTTITLQTIDNPLDSDNVTLTNAGITTNGDVVVRAGDDLDTDAATSISGANISFFLDPVAGDADALGGIANVAGTFAGNVSVIGGDDADVFNPRGSGTFFFDGGDPATSTGDTLFLDGGGGGTVSVSAVQVNAPNRTLTVDIANVEDVNVTNTAALTVAGDIGNDTLTLAAVPASTSGTVEIANGPKVTFDTPSISNVDIDGGDGDDTFIVDVTGGLPDGTFNLIGGANVGPLPGDQIILQGTAPAAINAVTFDYTNLNDGFIDIDGVTNLAYTGMEPITSTIDVADVTLNFSALTETINITQSGTDVTVDSNNGETTTFTAPTNSLSINTGGGTDTVIVDGLDLVLSGSLAISDDLVTSDDTLQFVNNPTTVTTGSADFSMLDIEINVDLTVDGGLRLGDGTGTGEIRTAGMLKSMGEILFNEPVVLAGLTDVETGTTSQVLFDFPVDGGQNLTVIGGTLVRFNQVNGAATPLASLQVTTTNGPILLSDVTSSGTQTYNSPVTTNAFGGTVQLVSTLGGAITFASTINRDALMNDGLSIDTAGLVTLGGDIGNINPLDSFSVTTGQALNINNNVSTVGDITLVVTDSVAAGENLTIASPAVITSSAGNLFVTVGDDVDIQSGATISLPSGLLDVMADQTGPDPDTIGSSLFVNATITTNSGVFVSGGANADAFSITPQSGTTFTVTGGDPTVSPGDTLNINAGGVDVDIDAASGSITVSGAQSFTPNGIEELSLSNIGLLTVIGSVNPDNVNIAANPDVVGGDLLIVNGGLPIAISAVTSLEYNGSDGDDLLTFDATSGLPTTPVTFNGEGQDAVSGGDQITIIGSFTTQTLNYTAAITDGNTGTIELDGTVVTYTGLEPISAGDSADTILNFNTGVSNNATLQDNVSPGTIELRDNGSTFEDTIIPNPTNSLTINLGDQGDTLSVDALDTAYAASMIINGGTGNDNVLFNAVTISGTPGRGLDVAGVETLGIADSTFSNNTATVGAGLRVIGGTTTIDNSTFSMNTATGDAADEGGGAIFNGSTMTIGNGTDIDGNIASGILGSGGGILNGAGGTLTVMDSTISNNRANRAGGGIETNNGNDLTLTNVQLVSNNAGADPAIAAPGNGGGLHVTGDANVVVTGGSVSDNVAAREGGGLWNDLGTMTIRGGTFIDSNTASGDAADDGGGGIFNNGGSVVITGAATRLLGNIANGLAGSGGGIFNNTGGTISVTDASLVSNVANRAGGGIEDASGAGLGITLTNVILGSNNAGASPAIAAPGNGGGLHVTGAGDVNIIGGEVNGNIAAAEGGGLWNGTGTMTIANGTAIVNNIAQGDLDPAGVSTDLQGGGGIFNNGGTLTIDGTASAVTVVNNQASGSSFGSGGGILSIGGPVTLTNADIRANEAVRAGGGIELIDGTVTLSNTAVFGNDVSAADLTGSTLGANPGNGGGVHITGAANLTVNGGIVSSNVAGLEGGGLWNSATGTLTLQNGAIVEDNIVNGNAADDGGGGLFNNGGSVVITGATTTIRNNTANGTSGSGGGIFNNTGGTVAITDAVIAGNTAFGVGGGIEDASGAGLGVTIVGGSLINNRAGAAISPTLGDGGGLHVTGLGDATVTGTLVQGNTAAFGGGGLFSDLGTLTVEGGAIIENNLASGDATDDGGGGIYNNGGSLVITDETTVIRNNQAPGTNASGGGIFSTQGSVSITDATVTGNTAAIDGGGLFADGNGAAGGAVTLTNATFSLNIAGDSGGGAFIIGPTTTIADSNFDANQALGSLGADGVGGGLYVRGQIGSGNFAVNNTIFDMNSARGGGAGAFFVDANGAIDGGGYTANQVTGNGIAFDSGGGGIAIIGETVAATVGISNVTVDGNTSPSAAGIGIVDATVTINNSTISNNTAVESASGAGGIGALATGPNGGNLLTIDGSTVSGNTTAGEGGGIGVIDGDILITDTSITGNLANGGRGGGLGMLNNGFGGAATIRSSTIAGNTASLDGGGLAFDNTGLDLENVTISGNDSGDSGGGIAYNNLVSLTASISYSTLTSNTSVSGGSNISATGNAIDVRGSIFNNGTSLASPGVLNSLGGNLDSGNTSGFDQSNDLINTDPLIGPLQDNTGPVFTHALLTGSPAIDAGPATGPATDARGIARPNGLAFDIGAFEGESAATLTINDVTVNEGIGTATVTVTLNIDVAGGFTVNFTTADNTAIQPGDYTTTAGVLTFAGTAGETQTFNVPIINDNVVEASESITVLLSNPSNTTVNVSDTALINITDNDTTVLSVNDVSIDEAGGSAIVTVSLSNAVQGGFTVDFATLDGTATQPDDYTLTNGTLPFAGTAGESQTITIPIVSDAVPEPDQQFTVALSNVIPLGPNPAPATSIDATDVGVVTITETAVTVDLATAIVDNTDPILVGGSVVYTVTLNNLGSNVASDVLSTTTFPPELTIESVSSSAGTVNVVGRVVTVGLTTLADGSSETITINAIAGATPGTAVVNTTVTSAETDSDSSNNSDFESTTINMLPPSTTISGTVFCDINNNRVNDLGAEIVVTRVFLDLNDNGQFDGNDIETTTNSVGFYQFDNVIGTNVNVSVMVPLTCNTIPSEPGVRRSIIEVGNLARGIAAAHVDSDGLLDLLVAADQSDSLSVLMNSANGFVTPATNLPAGDRPQSVFAYQPDPMNPPVVAVASIGTPTSGGSVHTFLGQSPQDTHPGIGGPFDVLIDDFNNDTIPDVLSASFRESRLELRLGGSSEVLSTTSNAAQILSIASGNLVDPETSREVVVSGFGYGQTTTLEVLGMDSAGNATVIASKSAPASAVEVAIENIIGNDPDDSVDDFVDEIVQLVSDGKILVYPMQNGLIGDPIESSVSPGATAFDFGDFNRDGMTDVAVANLGGQFIELYSGDGKGKFFRVTTLRNVSAPSDLVVGDFTGDGFDDIAVSNFYTDDNINNPNLPRAFRVPSTVTILQLEIASRTVMVTTSQQDFRLPSADPIVLMDTNGDGLISPQDALLVINVLSRESRFEGEGVHYTGRAATDVNGDGRTSAVDALMIINALAAERVPEGSLMSLDDMGLADDDDDRDKSIASIDYLLANNLV